MDGGLRITEPFWPQTSKQLNFMSPTALKTLNTTDDVAENVFMGTSRNQTGAIRSVQQVPDLFEMSQVMAYLKSKAIKIIVGPIRLT